MTSPPRAVQAELERPGRACSAPSKRWPSRSEKPRAQSPATSENVALEIDRERARPPLSVAARHDTVEIGRHHPALLGTPLLDGDDRRALRPSVR